MHIQEATYTVFDCNDTDRIFGNALTAPQAMDEILSRDGYAYEIRRGADHRHQPPRTVPIRARRAGDASVAGVAARCVGAVPGGSGGGKRQGSHRMKSMWGTFG